MTMLLAGLGGLLTPEMSEASGTTLTLQVDSGTPVNILGASTTCPSGYTQCYKVNYNAAFAFGSNNRSYKVQLAPGTTDIAKLLINDTSQDKVVLTGVQFAPTSTSSWPNTETHVLKIVWTNTFDASPNTAGSYVFALSSTGYLKAAGGTSPLYTQYDGIRFEGTGTFSPSLVNVALLNVAPATTNRTPLTLPGIANQAAATSFTLSQVVTYPTFGCDSDGAASGTQCKPAIKITMTVTVYGPDTLVLTNSGLGVGGGPCKLTPADPGVTEPTGNPIPCHASGKKKSQDDGITDEITEDVTESLATAVAQGAVPAVVCTPEDNCPCADPYDPKCAGSIIHVLEVTPATSETFPFTTVGPGIDSSSYAITTDARGVGSYTFSSLPALGGGPWIFQTGTFPSLPAEPGKFWDVDNIDCESRLEPKSSVYTTWTMPQGSVKNFVRVDTLKGGDTLTCTWHIHKNSAN